MVGSPGESHPQAPTELCVTVSRYTASVLLITGTLVSMLTGRRAQAVPRRARQRVNVIHAMIRTGTFDEPRILDLAA